MDTHFDFHKLAGVKGWEHLAEAGITFGINLAAALAIFIIGRKLAARIVRFEKAALDRAKVNPTLSSFLGSVTNIGLLLLVIIAALGQLGIPTASLTALVGGAGLAVALSLKDQLSNFAAGALIIFFRPFQVGDYIKVNGFEGYVREIKMVQTSLRTYADEEIILPNSVVMGNSIVNKSSLPLWRAQVLVNIPTGSDIGQAKAAVLKAAQSCPECLQTDPPSVQVTAITGGSIQLTLWAWTNEADWWQVQCGLNEAVVARLREEGIGIV